MAAVEIGSVRTSSSAPRAPRHPRRRCPRPPRSRTGRRTPRPLAAERIDALGHDVDLQVGAGDGRFLARRGSLLPLLVLGLRGRRSGGVLGLLEASRPRPRPSRRSRSASSPGPRGLVDLGGGRPDGASGRPRRLRLGGGTSTVASSASSYASRAASSAEPAISRASSVGTACPSGCSASSRLSSDSAIRTRSPAVAVSGPRADARGQRRS